MNSLRTVLALILTATAASAAPVVIYETGWEAAPASPGWALGNVAPQNGWINFNSAAGHTVVANGTAGATVGGQAVVTPFGNQFHRFNGSTSTTAVFDRLVWPDATDAFADRPAGHNLLTGTIDLFVPGVQSSDASLYGLFGFDGADLDFGVVVQPSARRIALIVDGGIAGILENAFTFNSWQNLGVTANYETGEIMALLNGMSIGLSGMSTNILDGGFTDLDLAVENATTAPTTRSVFSDNYRVIVDVVPVPEPGTVALLACGAGLFLLRLRRTRR